MVKQVYRFVVYVVVCYFKLVEGGIVMNKKSTSQISYTPVLKDDFISLEAKSKSTAGTYYKYDPTDKQFSEDYEMIENDRKRNSKH